MGPGGGVVAQGLAQARERGEVASAAGQRPAGFGRSPEILYGTLRAGEVEGWRSERNARAMERS